MQIKHMIFDLDGTLWNTSELSAMAYNRILSDDGRSVIRVTPDMIKQEFGKTVDTIADDLFPEFDKTIRLELMEKCDQSNTAFLEESECNLLYPGVRATLEQL